MKAPAKPAYRVPLKLRIRVKYDLDFQLVYLNRPFTQ